MQKIVNNNRRNRSELGQRIIEYEFNILRSSMQATPGAKLRNYLSPLTRIHLYGMGRFLIPEGKVTRARKM